MKVRSSIVVLVALAVAGIACTPQLTHAAIFLSDLQAGVVNELEDDDYELLVNAGGSIDSPGVGVGPGLDTTVDAGDFLFGIARITALRVPPGSSPADATASDTEATITAYFLTKVLSVANAGASQDGINDVVYTFGAASLAEWSSVTGITPTTAGTALVLYADPDNITPGAATASAALASVNGTKLWEIGFDATNTANRWTAQSDTNDLTTAFLDVTGSFSARLDVLATFGGPQLAPQTVSGGAVDVILTNGSFGAVGTGAFGVASDVDFLIKPVPEPASMLVWAGSLLVGGVFAARRKRRKVA